MAEYGLCDSSFAECGLCDFSLFVDVATRLEETEGERAEAHGGAYHRQQRAPQAEELQEESRREVAEILLDGDIVMLRKISEASPVDRETWHNVPSVACNSTTCSPKQTRATVHGEICATKWSCLKGVTVVSVSSKAL